MSETLSSSVAVSRPEVLKPKDLTKGEFLSSVAALGLGVSQILVRNAVESSGTTVPRDSLMHPLLYNSGDFTNGFTVTLAADTFMRFSIPRMPYRLRKGISSLIGAASIVLVESPLIHGFGTPDIADIPAGIIGVACYLGVSLWLNKVENQFTAVK